LYIAQCGWTTDRLLIREVSFIQSVLYREVPPYYHSLPEALAHPGGLVHDRVIHAIDLSGSIGKKLVLLDLVGEQKLVHELLRSPSQHLVEDMVAALPSLLENDTRLLQEV